MFLKVVAVTEAVVRRDGQVRAEGCPYDHATLGPLEDWLEAQVGPGVTDGIAERAVLYKRYVKGKYRRLLSAAFMIRVIVLWPLMPEARLGDVVMAVAGDLALLPWSRQRHPASERACLDWRKTLGPARWRNCRTPSWPRLLASTPGGTGSPSRSGRTGR